MEMFYIVLLVFFGLLFLVAELVLLPGVSIGAVLALVCYGSSVYLAFRDWQRFSLKQEIRSSSMPVTPAEELQVGDRGVTLSRLSPMGKVEIGGRTYEAKSQGAYVDPQRDVEVVGFENFSVIVKTIK